MAEQRYITVSAAGVIGIKVVDPDIGLCHRYCLTPGDDLSGQPSDVSAAAKEAWTPEVVAAWQAAHPGPTTEELARVDAMRAADAARKQAIVDALPSWTVVAAKFDAMISDAQAAASLAVLRGVVVELARIMKRIARVVYWLAKNSET